MENSNSPSVAVWLHSARSSPSSCWLASGRVGARAKRTALRVSTTSNRTGPI